MKKIVAVFLIAVVSLTLCGCFKSEDAQKVDDQIDAIGKVSLFSYSKINKAEQAVNALEEKDRKYLDNLGLLEEAKKEYGRLLCEDASKKITAIGEVTLESAGKIDEAQLAVSKLDSAQFNSLPEKNIYLKAIDDYATLKAAEVTAIIDAIGTVTLDSKETIDAAKVTYNALDAAAKKKVENYAKIREAEEKLSELEKAEEERLAKAAIGRLRTKYDKVEGITWYYAKCSPYYANTRSFILPYIGKRDSGYVWLRLEYHYTGDRWIFYEDITIVIDGEKYYKSFDYSEVERDNGSGDVWEVVDVSPSSSDIAMLEAIANSKETIVRFEGDERRKDITISAADKQGIKDVLAAYEYMK